MRQGMRRLREDGLEKVRQGRTSIAEVCRVTGVGRLADADGARTSGRHALKDRGRTSDRQAR